MDKEHEEMLLKHGVIKLIGPIDDNNVSHVELGLDLARENKIRDITLEICSTGGELLCAGKIFDKVSNFAGTVTGLVRPYAYSGAANILQACHRRFALPHSLLHYHHTRKIPLSLRDFPLKLQEITLWTERQDRITRQRSGLTKAEFNNLKNLDFVISAEQALRLGLIDRIIKPPRRNHHVSRKNKPLDLEINEISTSGICRLLGFLDHMRDKKYPPISITFNLQTVCMEYVLPTYQLLKQYPGYLTVIGAKTLFAQASIMLLAGDRRKLHYNAKIKLEETIIGWEWIQLPQLNSRLGQELMREQLELTETYIRREFTSRTKLSASKFRELHRNDGVYDAGTAQKYGIIHEIVMPKHLKK